jgi:hypothetical protein
LGDFVRSVGGKQEVGEIEIATDKEKTPKKESVPVSEQHAWAYAINPVS